MDKFKIFKPILKRTELLSIPLSKDVEKISIGLHRNHSFEMIANVIEPFLNFSRLHAEFFYGDYDDSLNFNIPNIKINPDIEMIWLDLSRYKDIELLNWLEKRLKYLRSKTQSPIIFFHTGEKNLKSLENVISGLLVVNIQDIISPILGKDEMWDLEKEQYSGTRLSNKSCLLMAKAIGCKYIPSVIKPALKAIVIDLDNTIYQGVLGEDGIEEVIPYLNLQNKLKELKNQGFLLAIASKNEFDDVKQLFEKRKDFVLQWNDFSAYQINWDSKSENILEISKTLNIGIDSLLFIDDNVGEIENVKMHHPEINIIEAVSPETTLNIIEFYPGLFKENTTKEDAIRSNDLKANNQRKAFAKTLSEKEYFKKLEVILTYAVNPIENSKRISELLNKTNQFIFSYKRYNEAEVIKLMTDKNSCIVTISLSDKLSDSGVIGIVVAENKSDNLFINELCISCRALGRNIEDLMLTKAFFLCCEKLQTTDNVCIEYKIGEKNKPALEWLQKYFKKKITGENIFGKIQKVSFEGLKIITK